MKPRRHFLLSCASATAGLTLAPLRAQNAEIAWQNTETWEIEGRGWPNEERLRFYDRFPAKAQKTLREPVWNLSRDSAGMAVRFKSDAQTIHVRYQLKDGGLAMAHMPATGVSGIDLYARDAANQWRWVNVTRPTKQTVETKLADGLDPGEREFMAYFPLYNGVEKVEFGVPAGAKLDALPARGKPIVFYGTSITHGACASRPGMCHPAILGRKLDREVLNLGFSGNGRMEIEVADLLCEVDASVFVIDCLPNITGPTVVERTQPLVRRIREAKPETPIVLVEDRTYDYAWIKQSSRDRHEASRAALRAAFDQLVADGVPNLHYIEGADLLGRDGEGTTDGSHPNDLGFMRQADAMLPTLRKVLG